MHNHYETVFIITPLLTTEQMKEVVEKFKGYCGEHDAQIIHEENWGLRKLAYPIRKKSTGFYHLLEYKADTSMIEKLETEFRRDERVLRFLTVKLDKYGIQYNEKRRKGELGKNFEEEAKKKASTTPEI